MVVASVRVSKKNRLFGVGAFCKCHGQYVGTGFAPRSGKALPTLESEADRVLQVAVRAGHSFEDFPEVIWFDDPRLASGVIG